MQENIYVQLHRLLGGVLTESGELAWTSKQIPSIMELTLENDWIILGGDVLTSAQRYAYDNWYYEPNEEKSLEFNVRASILECSQYVSIYVDKNGDDFLFVIVISNTYVSGH